MWPSYDCENIIYHSQCTAFSVNTCKTRALYDSNVVLNLVRYLVYKSLPLWQVAMLKTVICQVH